MKQSEYCRAVDKLEFSDNLAARVRAKAERRPRFRLLPRVVIAAVLACFMITTAFGAVSFLRQRTAEVTPVGSDAVKLTNAKLMEFTVSEMTAGVDIHYMELKPKQRYSFRHGMLRNTALGYLHITDDYALEPMEMNSVELKLEKNDRVYTFEFDYLEIQVIEED